MSSQAFRNLVKDWFATNHPELAVVEISDDDVEIPAPATLSTWVGLQFIQASDDAVSVGNGDVAYREDGVFYIHIVSPTGFSSAASLALADSLRYALRGSRIGDAVIQSCYTPTDQNGAAIQIDGPWHGWSVMVEYYFDN